MQHSHESGDGSFTNDYEYNELCTKLIDFLYSSRELCWMPAKLTHTSMTRKGFRGQRQMQKKEESTTKPPLPFFHSGSIHHSGIVSYVPLLRVPHSTSTSRIVRQFLIPSYHTSTVMAVQSSGWTRSTLALGSHRLITRRNEPGNVSDCLGYS